MPRHLPLRRSNCASQKHKRSSGVSPQMAPPPTRQVSSPLRPGAVQTLRPMLHASMVLTSTARSITKERWTSPYGQRTGQASLKRSVEVKARAAKSLQRAIFKVSRLHRSISSKGQLTGPSLRLATGRSLLTQTSGPATQRSTYILTPARHPR